MKLLEITDELVRRLDGLSFGAPVTHVYNPLVYARAPHERYLRRFGRGKGRILLLGMNPGPWGMAQTGVPFGEVSLVRDWMGIDEPVEKPEDEHPARPIEGFACGRSEVSGARLWGWARERFGTPKAFFSRFFVLNYCPLVFMEESGKNRTPDKLPKEESAPVNEVCDDVLRQMVTVLAPARIVGVGAFAEKRAKAVAGDLGIPIDRILHPSPASPIANRGWAERAEAEFEEMGVELP